MHLTRTAGEVATITRVSVLLCATLFIVAVCGALVLCSSTVMFVNHNPKTKLNNTSML